MINSVVLQGRLTHNPELKTIPNGTSVVSFSIAVQRSYSRDAEKKVDYIDVVAWRQTAEFVCKYFTKGMSIGITGRIQTDTYTDKEGKQRKRVEVYADKVDFLESKKSADVDTEFTPIEIADESDDLPF